MTNSGCSGPADAAAAAEAGRRLRPAKLRGSCLILPLSTAAADRTMPNRDKLGALEGLAERQPLRRDLMQRKDHANLVNRLAISHAKLVALYDMLRL